MLLAYIPEYDLNLQNGEDNVNGIFAFVSPSFVFGNEQVEVVVLHKQVHDIKDVRDATNPVTMSLLPDGTGILVEEPALPNFMASQIDALYDGCESIDMENALQTNHAVCVTAIKQNSIRQKKKYILKFPGNLSCKMGYMNATSGHTLRGHVQVSKSVIKNKGGIAIPFTHVTIRFMAVVNTSQQKLLKEEDDSTSNIEDLLAGMSLSMMSD